MLAVRGIYRGREGMWAWLLHRVTGVGVLFFLLIHILDTALVLFGPELYNHAIGLYRMPAFRVMEVVLAGSVLYHALNGVRITLIDFWDKAVKWNRQLFYGEVVLFFVLFLPSAYMMLRPVFFGGH